MLRVFFLVCVSISEVRLSKLTKAARQNERVRARADLSSWEAKDVDEDIASVLDTHVCVVMVYPFLVLICLKVCEFDSLRSLVFNLW